MRSADVYDPKAVRASTGSLFAVPVVRVPAHRAVLSWVADLRAVGHDFTQPTLAVIGNETTGLSSGWRQVCDQVRPDPHVRVRQLPERGDRRPGPVVRIGPAAGRRPPLAHPRIIRSY
ncbi:hypothetical protein JCM9534A_02520 [Catenuloplanes indicus JCM 9534]|uniref:Uncharacterized protein n=1 Tax=Catenuloplanes indicus TaxID=137267 RepID=A0AAE3VUN8_9ACTN|nr:hypothetical protein [Catenuloplanes indicus]